MGGNESAKQTKFEIIASKLLRATISAALPFFGRVEIIGIEKIGVGGRLLVSNHIGWADPIWIAYACHPRLLHQMAKRELFRGGWTASFLAAFGAFPVDRGRPSPTTIKHAASLLRRGDWLLVFPTGTRDQSQKEARRGAALIASLASASIIPVHYDGPTTIRFAHLIKRPRILVRFGPEIDVRSGSHDRRTSARLTQKLDAAIQAVAASSPPSP